MVYDSTARTELVSFVRSLKDLRYEKLREEKVENQ